MICFALVYQLEDVSKHRKYYYHERNDMIHVHMELIDITIDEEVN